ncbi:MAG: hypothetical protein HKL82_01430 [Acidimicrobiaceae bacterium]|nr:hypothetical protein [Acidimicrobiaceae bacterium]
MARKVAFWGGLLAILALYFIAVFPTTGLLSEHSQLNAAKVQLAQVESENRLLEAQASRLNRASVITKLAEAKYGMVPKGQTGTIVLPSTPTSK